MATSAGRQGAGLYASVFFRNSAVNNFIGCNFEGGGVVGRIVIDVTYSTALNFVGCYFENGHTYLLRDDFSQNGVSFHECHFTYAVGGAKYQFLGSGRVTFGHNDWYLPSDGAAKMFLAGPSDGKLGTTTSKLEIINALSVYKIASGSTTYPVGAQKDLVIFAANPQDNLLSTQSMLTGVLTVNYQSINTGGTGNVKISRRYHINVASVAGLTLTAGISQISAIDDLQGSTLTISAKAGATPLALTLQAVFTGNATPSGSVFNWAFESDCASTSNAGYIVPSIA